MINILFTGVDRIKDVYKSVISYVKLYNHGLPMPLEGEVGLLFR